MTKTSKILIAIASSLLIIVIRLVVGAAPWPENPLIQKRDTLPSGNVIFITLDGVREQDIAQTWTALQSRIRDSGYFFGLRKDQEEMWISNSAGRSLAGYRALFMGRYERWCWRNDCDSSDRPTFVDALLDSGAAPEDVALFSSWKQLALAVEAHPRAVRSLGFEPLRNTVSLTRPQLEKINQFETEAERVRPAWDNSRKDEYTWAMAVEYGRIKRPRFQYISLVDSDEFGHADQFGAYRNSLLQYEKDILDLIAEVESRPGGDRTSFVITTDHGRGDKIFKWHGWWDPSSARIWAALIPSKSLRKRGVHKLPGRLFRQVDLRPTIEYLLGLPVSETRQGEPLVLLNEETEPLKSGK